MNTLISEDITMTLMRVRRAAQLTLPADIRQALNVKEGDYLEASITPEGVLLKPMSVVQRERAWQRIKEITAQVVNTQPNPNEDATVEEERIAGEVKAFRRADRRSP
jgi:AbrB family looped-hinge helix DNA binding protein